MAPAQPQLLQNSLQWPFGHHKPWRTLDDPKLLSTLHKGEASLEKLRPVAGANAALHFPY